MRTSRLHLAAAVVTALGLGASLTGCSNGSTASSSSSSTLTLGSQVDVTSWDPAAIGAGHYLQYMQPVYDSLLQLDENGDVVADLATDYSWDKSRTHLTLELRDDVTFTDGTAFDADAVVANIEAMKNGSGAASGSLASVTDATADDADTVTLNLSEPDPGLVQSLTDNGGYMASPAAISDGSLDTEPVGTGPYMFDAGSSTTGSEYHFVRNTDYWDSDAYPYDEVVIQPLTDDSARLAALQSGAVDAASGLAQWVEQAEASDLVVQQNVVDWNGLFLDDRDGTINPALGDVRVRRAINYAFDREAILEKYQLGYGSVSTQVFNPGSEAYDESLNDYYDYDPEKAQQLLAEAGYPDGFTLTLPSSDWTSSFDAVVQQQLGDIGITVEYESMPTTNVLSRLPDFAAHKFSWSMFADPWGVVRDLVLPDGAANYQHSTDKTVESLVAEIRTASEDERADLYQQLNKHLVEQAWFAPWYATDVIYIHSDAVEVTQLPGNIVPPLSLYAPAS
ncbi:ABC transporter substrate-binding protein [Nocardioides bruguierae]|uniref:ABC transporter substrate-binding protein n=1 Tax=Nocardioides bruguierae TaxID=2945102 RepID=A0A9X2DB69_9ACTN|nr:ABC transporter substrate-binding protein [Nocardioides bruguierae]MCL8026894.1 ABC transporter substrate-binding protein [Nocardioides bruguierae]MCM0621389.1 ABC transporter substrate-binding protein [Nocardioides bruguierae]